MLTLLICLWCVMDGVDGTFITVNRGLKVTKGQSAFLMTDDLQFDIPKEKDACKVEVITNEPITQRVGKLTPLVFDCHFLPDEVKYTHYGCPILDEDRVMFRLYRFTTTETFTEVFTLHVKLMEPDCNMIKLGPQVLEVPEFHGLSQVIDSNVLSFDYEHTPNLECTVRVATQESLLPAHGQLVIGEPERTEPRGDVPHSFGPARQRIMTSAMLTCKDGSCSKGMKLVETTKVNCRDFLLMGLRYQHLSPPSPAVDYIAIRLDLTDTRSRTTHKAEHAWIPVHIKNAIPNQPPKASFMSMFILEVDQFILTSLSTATLDAEDSETPKDLLVFNITRPPQQGYITHLTDHTKPITSFTWKDLNEILIAYQPPNGSHTERRNFEMECEVYDFFFVQSSPFVVHISVRTADTNAPRVSWNMGLDLLEGQTRPITWEQLQIVDNDNIKNVQIITVDGLQHGRLTVRGGKGFMFTVNDIKANEVRYHHDDSDTTKDFIVFRISDGRHSIRHKFPINILPKDDSPPFLITNMVLELCEGQSLLIQLSMLQASDMDSCDDYILFNITQPPTAGEIRKKPGPLLTGYPVQRFLQRDLFNAIIYYHHLGNEVFEDSFEFVLSDSHDPPNLSEPQVVMVHITPVDDQLPKESPGTSRHLVVKETEVVHITKKQLHFTDPESPDRELTYTITTLPYFTSLSGRPDAGKLFLLDSTSKFTKDATVPMLRSFTQHAVNFMKVAYMPPIQDIGPEAQHIQFIFSVSNQHGATVIGICFNITVLPEDNQAPQVFTNELTVQEGGACQVTEKHLIVVDQDTKEERIWIQLVRKPQHGHLEMNAFPIQEGGMFSLQDLKSHKIRYHHDSSETSHDKILFFATDGIQSTDFVLHFKVLPVNDEAPVVKEGLRSTLHCGEGHEVIITTEYLYATDSDSDDGHLIYMIARQPYYGVIRKNGVIVDQFIQADIVSRIITYQHTGGEVGLKPRIDTITFVISDGNAASQPGCCPSDFQAPAVPTHDNLPVYDLNVTVFPVDNQPPTIVIGEMFVVDEGSSASITLSHLNAHDPDTSPDHLEFILASPPQFGYIENTLPSPGFEKSNMGISIGSFALNHVKQNHINYVQSRHERIEPTTDQFLLYVTDGKRRSRETPFYVIINPANDEVPDFLARNITVQEGQMKELDASIINVVDLDIPRDQLVFTITKQPQHGMIMNGIYGNDIARYRRLAHNHLNNKLPVYDFTIDSLRHGMKVMYLHDDSENMADGFAVQLSDGKHKVHRYVSVKILPVNDEKPQVIRNSGIHVEMGESRIISSAVLEAEDKDTPQDLLIYTFDRVPKQGVLQLKGDSGWTPLADGMTCAQEDIDMNLLRYVHTGALSSDVHDSFVFHVKDGGHQSPPQTFSIIIKDMKKGDIAVFAKPLRVSKGERAILTTSVLMAEDSTDKPEELLFVITSPPTSGHLEYVNHPGVPITSFSQMDIAASMVCYVHSSAASLPKDMFRFIVSNGVSTRNRTLEITVEMSDRHLPTVSQNAGLQVPEGSMMVIPTEALQISDPDTPAQNLTFLLAQRPQFGQLFRRGSPLQQRHFTQFDVDSLHMAYKHGGGGAQIDRFSFVASDGTNSGFIVDGKMQTEPIFFMIQVEPLDKSAPRIIHHQCLTKVDLLQDGRYAIYISSYELKATDADTKDEDIYFNIVRAPHFSYLENVTTGELIQRRFTQKDLNRRTIRYIIKPFLGAVSDSVEFQNVLILSVSGVAYQATRVASRTLSINIVNDGLEEGEELFEVLLNSPVNTVLGERVKTTVKIHDTTGGHCHTTKNRHSAPEIGQAIPVAVDYRPPHHGSIRLEKLPIVPVDSVGLTRGDVPQEPKPLSQTKLRVVGNGKTVRPSSVHRNGTDLVFTYHGLMSLRVEDESSPPTSDKKARVLVTSKGQQRHRNVPPGVTELFHADRGAVRIPGQVDMNPPDCSLVQTETQDTLEAVILDWHQVNPRVVYVWYECDMTRGQSNYRKYCALWETHHGSLVSILSKSDMDWLWDFSGRTSFWIGLNDRVNAGQWEWVGGEPVSYTNWRKEPSRARKKGGTNCVQVQKRGKWQVKDCKKGKHQHFVCHVKP
ncbi:FREM1 protein, partial [Polypterus senegalus]